MENSFRKRKENLGWDEIIGRTGAGFYRDELERSRVALSA
jgi:hypothetical protein